MISKATVTSLMNVMLSLALVSCVTKTNPPCYDGWTSNKNGSSQIWMPTLQEENALKAKISTDHEIRCFHRTSDLKVTVITELKRKLYYFEFETLGRKFELVDDGIIFTQN